MLRKDLTGKIFGRLTVIKVHSRTRNGHVVWTCNCECGAVRNVIATHLQQGHTISCGRHVKKNKDRKDWKGCGELSGRKWGQIKNGANGAKSRRKIPFKLTIKQAWSLFLKQDRKCALSDLPLSFPEKWDSTGTASLDRINSDGPYSTANVQWVHKDINKMKNSFDQDYFKELCKLITNKA